MPKAGFASWIESQRLGGGRPWCLRRVPVEATGMGDKPSGGSNLTLDARKPGQIQHRLGVTPPRPAKKSVPPERLWPSGSGCPSSAVPGRLETLELHRQLSPMSSAPPWLHGSSMEGSSKKCRRSLQDPYREGRDLELWLERHQEAGHSMGARMKLGGSNSVFLPRASRPERAKTPVFRFRSFGHEAIEEVERKPAVSQLQAGLPEAKQDEIESDRAPSLPTRNRAPGPSFTIRHFWGLNQRKVFNCRCRPTLASKFRW